MGRKSDIKQGDYVTFYTKYGQRTGIVEYIMLDGGPHHTCPVAHITVRSFSFKPKSYKRPLYKLKRAT